MEYQGSQSELHLKKKFADSLREKRDQYDSDQQAKHQELDAERLKI
jgi:hypothetical protein